MGTKYLVEYCSLVKPVNIGYMLVRSVWNLNSLNCSSFNLHVKFHWLHAIHNYALIRWNLITMLKKRVSFFPNKWITLWKHENFRHKLSPMVWKYCSWLADKTDPIFVVIFVYRASYLLNFHHCCFWLLVFQWPSHHGWLLVVSYLLLNLSSMMSEVCCL